MNDESRNKMNILEELYFVMQDIVSCNACNIYNSSKYQNYYEKYGITPKIIDDSLLNDIHQSVIKLIDFEAKECGDNENEENDVMFIKLPLMTCNMLNKVNESMPAMESNPKVTIDVNRRANTKQKWDKLLKKSNIGNKKSKKDLKNANLSNIDANWLYIGKNFVFYRSVDINVLNEYNRVMTGLSRL